MFDKFAKNQLLKVEVRKMTEDKKAKRKVNAPIGHKGRTLV